VHELSIVEALIEQVEKEVEHCGHQGRVLSLALTIGRLSGVNAEAVRFSYELLSPGTIVEGAELQISEPKATCCCRACGARTELDELDAYCPECGSDQIVIEGGRELLLQSIELEDESEVASLEDDPG